MNSGWRSYSLCATLLQVGRDTQTLKEPVTRWHRAARSHLCCRDTIVFPGSTLSRQRCLFCGLWHRWVVCRVAATPAFTAILLCSHVTTDKTNKSQNRYFAFVLPPPSCFAFFIPPPPPPTSSLASVSVFQESLVCVLKHQ